MVGCPICTNVFDSDKTKAHCFDCGHLVCLKCITKLRKPGCPLNCPLPSFLDAVPSAFSEVRRLNVDLAMRVYLDCTEIVEARDCLAETKALLEVTEEELEEKAAELEEKEAELAEKEEELEEKDETIRELEEELAEKESELEEKVAALEKKDRLIRQLEKQLKQLNLQRSSTSQEKRPAGKKKEETSQPSPKHRGPEECKLIWRL